jgi:hypothetical protein
LIPPTTKKAVIATAFFDSMQPKLLVFSKIHLTRFGKLSLMALQAGYDSSFSARDAFAKLFRIVFACLIKFLSFLTHHRNMVHARLGKLGLMAFQARPDPALARLYSLAEFFHVGLAHALVHFFIMHLRHALMHPAAMHLSHTNNRNQEKGRYRRAPGH